MKMIMDQCQAGVRFVRNPGDPVEVEKDEGVRMIDSGIAHEATQAEWKLAQERKAEKEQADREEAERQAARHQADIDRRKRQAFGSEVDKYAKMKADAKAADMEFAVVKKYETAMARRAKNDPNWDQPEDEPAPNPELDGKKPEPQKQDDSE